MKELCSVPKTALTNPTAMERLKVAATATTSTVTHPDRFQRQTTSPIVHPDKLFPTPSPSASREQVAAAGTKGPSTTGGGGGSSGGGSGGAPQGQEPSNGERTYTLEGAIKRVDYGHCVLTAGDASFKLSVTGYTGATAAVPRHVVTFGAEWLVLAGNQPYNVALQGMVLDCTAAQVFEDFDHFVKTSGRTQYDKYHQPVVPEKPATLEIQGTLYQGIYTSFHWSKAAQNDTLYQVSVSFIGIVAERTAQKTPQNAMTGSETPAPYGTAEAVEGAEMAAAGFPGAWGRVLESQASQLPNGPTADFTPSTFTPTRYPGWEGYASAISGDRNKDGLSYKPSGDYAYTKPAVEPHGSKPRPGLADPGADEAPPKRLAVETRGDVPVSVPTSWSQVYDGTRVRDKTETGGTSRPTFAASTEYLFAQRGDQTMMDYFPDPGYRFGEQTASTTIGRTVCAPNVPAYTGTGRVEPAYGFSRPLRTTPTEFTGTLDEAIRS